MDGADLSAGAVLDPWLPSGAVLRGEGDEVAFAQAVVDAGQRGFRGVRVRRVVRVGVVRGR